MVLLLWLLTHPPSLSLYLYLSTSLSSLSHSFVLAFFPHQRHVIQAVLVRIMKSRRTMPHKDLSNECFTQLIASNLFEPSTKQIKREIEDLIEKDYLERDEVNQKMLKYLA